VAGGGEDRTVVAKGRGTLMHLKGGGNKKGGGGEAPTEVKPTARGAELTREGSGDSSAISYEGRQNPTPESRHLAA
jgi:hypothetical protein